MNDRRRILWLHTQPEHYFNCMMDDLAASDDFEYISAFSYAGPKLYKDNPQPQKARTVFLRAKPGLETRAPQFREAYHVDWKADLLPLKFDAVIIAGYGSRTPRELLDYCHAQRIPVMLWSDSNLRSQRDRSCKGKLRRRLKHRWLKPFIRKVDLMGTANMLGVAYWRYFGTPKAKIRLCPYYSDYARVARARESSRAETLATIGLVPSDRYVFTAARLVSVKGLDLALRAFLSGGFAARGYHYVIAGIGPLETELKALAGDASGKSIHFVGFQQPAVNLALMTHADLFLLPSVYEPHGIVVQESLAAGTPVLASDVVGAAYDLVLPKASGLLFKSGDAGALERQMSWLLADPQRLAAMRVSSRATFEEWFERTSPIKIIESLAHEMLSRKGGVARDGQR